MKLPGSSVTPHLVRKNITTTETTLIATNFS